MKKFSRLLILTLLAISVIIITPLKAKAAESNNYYIKVNKGTNVVTVYTNDGKPYKAMICSAGVPTPVGTFYTPAKYRWKALIHDSYGQYSTRITGGFLFHSVYYWTNGDPSSMPTSAYNLLGTLQSSGCVRLLVKDAKWIYDNCALGTKVTIFDGTSKDDPLGKPEFMRITNGQYTNWDPTDPDPRNPWRTASPSVTFTGSSTVQFKSNFNPLNQVVVRDALGNIVTSGVKIKGRVNTNKLGTYKVTYSFKDILDRSVKKTYTYKVIDSSKPIITGAKNHSIALTQSINLTSNVSAKTLTGTNLKKYLRIYYKARNTSKYRLVKGGRFKSKKAGYYDIKYYVKGTNNKVQTKYTTLQIIDKHVKLSVKNVTLEYGAYYKPGSYVTLKNYKGNNLSLTKNLIIKNTVNNQRLGSYKVTYTGMYNKLAYTKVTKTAIVTVVNNKAPLISGVDKTTTSFVSTDNTTLNLLAGITAKTATGIMLTPGIKVYVNGSLIPNSNYTFSTAGTYKVEYRVTVPGGTKTAIAVRNIVVTDPVPPIATP